MLILIITECYLGSDGKNSELIDFVQNNGDNDHPMEEMDGGRRRRLPLSARGGRGGGFGGQNRDREDGGRNRHEVCKISPI